MKNVISIILSFFKKKQNGRDNFLYEEIVEYRGLYVSFSVRELRNGERDKVNVLVCCNEINKGNYTITSIDEKCILSAFGQLFTTVKKLIDNHLDYDKNIKYALSKIGDLQTEEIFPVLPADRITKGEG